MSLRYFTADVNAGGFKSPKKTAVLASSREEVCTILKAQYNTIHSIENIVDIGITFDELTGLINRVIELESRIDTIAPPDRGSNDESEIPDV